MTAVSKNIFIEQGTTFTMSFQWRTPTGVGDATAPKNLTGWIFRMQARTKQQGIVAIDATTANGKITLGIDPTDSGAAVTPTNGWVRLKLTDDETDLLAIAATKYDLEAESPTGDVYRLLQGSVTISPNITQEPEDPEVG